MAYIINPKIANPSKDPNISPTIDSFDFPAHRLWTSARYFFEAKYLTPNSPIISLPTPSTISITAIHSLPIMSSYELNLINGITQIHLLGSKSVFKYAKGLYWRRALADETGHWHERLSLLVWLLLVTYDPDWYTDSSRTHYSPACNFQYQALAL